MKKYSYKVIQFNKKIVKKLILKNNLKYDYIIKKYFYYFNFIVKCQV